MQKHNIKIDKKYFEPIRNKEITLLIFKKQCVYDFEDGDCVLAQFGSSYDVEAEISRTYYKSFKDITEEEAKAAGFLNKDFLKDELISVYDLKGLFSFVTGYDIDDELFFLVELKDDEKNYPYNITDKVNLFDEKHSTYYYSNYTNGGFYND